VALKVEVVVLLVEVEVVVVVVVVLGGSSAAPEVTAAKTPPITTAPITVFLVPSEILPHPAEDNATMTAKNKTKIEFIFKMTHHPTLDLCTNYNIYLS
jgi:hypothetical protein